MLLAAANDQEFTISENVQTMCKGDLQMKRLSVHPQMLLDIIKTFGEEYLRSKLQISQTICQSVQEVPGAKDLCSEVDCLIQLFLTIPVTT